jgi:putative nucleotidyltransferase with HDIG domain
MQKKTPSTDQNSETHHREKYTDHRMPFMDWVNHSGFERTLLGKLLLFIEEKLQIRRFAFVLLYSLVLAYMLNFEFSTPTHYQVGDVAKTDVKSPVAYEMVDEVTTEEKRTRAEGTIPLIFDFDPNVFERVSSSVYRSFRTMRSELQAVNWPKSAMAREEKTKEFFNHKGEFDRELGVVVPDYIFERLIQHKFNVRIENVVIRNLSRWYDEKILDGVDKIIPSSKVSITARVVQRNAKGKEFSLVKKEIKDSSMPEDFVLRDLSGTEHMNEKEKSDILAFAQLLIYPNLTLNKQEIASRRQTARESVLPITISVKKNQTIINKDSVVHPFHMAMLKEIETRRSDKRKDIVTIAMGLFFLSIISVFFQYLRRFAGTRVKVDQKDVIAMGTVLMVMVLIVKAFWFFTENAVVSKFGSLIPSSVFLYAAPVAAGPMLVGLVIQSGEVVWLFTAFTAIAMSMMGEINFPFMLVTLTGGIAAARGVYGCKKRNDIYIAGVRTGIVNALVVALVITVAHVDQENFINELFIGVPAGFIGGITSSLVAMMLVPLFESLFNYTTDVKLLELSNLNHPLLKQMIVKAPGTYHHSMMVGSMVEAAAEEIGANPLLGKVMCYYHDIGKMEHANYFIENQKPGHNPHDHISPYMSRTLLVAHVKDGVELGMQYKLGKPIIDGVIQHHGTTLISFFFNKAIDQKNEECLDVSEEDFRYPGPKPQFREAALCMLADSIEAASRSLDEPTPVRLQNIVRNIIQRKFMDGQLDDCNLTLRDLSKVESAFSKILIGIYHQRIDYPRSSGGGTSEAAISIFANKA